MITFSHFAVQISPSLMPLDARDDLSQKFVDIAVGRELLTQSQADSLLEQSRSTTTAADELALQQEIMSLVDVEVTRAFAAPEEFVPGFSLRDVLGHGALGVVFQAIQPQLRRDVAVKVIPKDRLGLSNTMARFQQEGEVIGRLQHPNIVRAYDFGHHEGRAFLVMEFVSGKDLRERILDTPLPWLTGLSVMRQTAAGLSHALSHGVIHRDIKPGNLLLTDAPAGFDLPPGVPLVKVADFGLARFRAEERFDQQLDTQLTLTGTAMGTPMYSAPEQLTGDEVDHRTDVFGLGATVFHAITGQPPYEDGSFAKIMAAKVSGEQLRMELLPEDVPASVRGLLADMTASNRDDRIGDYDELIARIDGIYRGDTKVVDPVGSRPREPVAARPKRLRPLVWAAGIVTAAIMAIMGFKYLNRVPVRPETSFSENGWQEHLFKAKDLTLWHGLSGSTQAVKDIEGSSVLDVNGSTKREFTMNQATQRGFRLEINVDLLEAEAAEVHFGFVGEADRNSSRYVARYASDGVVVGSREGIGGELRPLCEVLDPPANRPDPPNYHSIHIERYGLWWRVLLDGELVHEFMVKEEQKANAFQLVTSGQSVHFEGLTVYGLAEAS